MGIVAMLPTELFLVTSSLPVYIYVRCALFHKGHNRRLMKLRATSDPISLAFTRFLTRAARFNNSRVVAGEFP